MKKILLILPLTISPLFACSNSGASFQDKTNLINKLLGHVNVDAKLEQVYDFGGPYSYLNFSNKQEINRDYGFIKTDNKTVPAIRENTTFSSITYYEGINGEAAYQVLNNKNEVITKSQYLNSMIVTYSDLYSNPFDFLDDIHNDFSLKSYKANMILQTIFGGVFNCESAKFVMKDGNAVAIDFVVRDYQFSYALGLELTLTTKIKTNISFKLKYDTPELTLVSPKTNDDQIIKNALESVSDNYTISLTSPNLGESCEVFVTEDAIYYHKDIWSVGMNNGDILYKKNGANFDKYIYRYSSNRFIKQQTNIRLSKILPSFNEISYKLFDKQSDNIYYLDSTASNLNAELLILNDYNYYPGEGISATVEIKDGVIKHISTIFGNSQRYIVDETISNYGTTTLPSWLDYENI